MPVICKLCNQSFDKQINNKHLKFKHNTTTADYKEKFGKDSLSCPEYKKTLSAARSGENNSNFGNKMSEQSKAAISKANAGNPAWNAGGNLTEKQKDNLRKKALARHASGFYDEYQGPLSETTKAKISKSVTAYAAANPNEMSDRAYAAIETKLSNGVDLAFFRGHRHTDESKKQIVASNAVARTQRKIITKENAEKLIQENYTIIASEDDWYYVLQCKHCGDQVSLTRQYFTESKYRPEPCGFCVKFTSRDEAAIGQYIRDLGFIIQTRDKQIIWPFELDIVVAEKNLAIEFDGLYYHGELAKRGALNGKDEKYHLTKTEQCKAKGIKLIHVFEDEWINSPSIVKSRIANALGMGSAKKAARDCSLVELSATQANTFLNANHLQGSGRSNKRFGLILNEELISVMTFNDSNVSRKGTEWEINRFATKAGISIVGGASKLFSAFVDQVNPYRITSFADRRWGEGTVYGELGFEFVENSKPNYWYFKTRDKRYHRFSFRKSELVKEGADPTQTEWEIMQSKGWDRIWDCGHAKWVWSAK